jgi:integrase
MKTRGMGSVYQNRRKVEGKAKRVPSGPWWIKYSHAGVTYREPTGSDVKDDAVKLLKKRIGEMGSGRFVGRAAETVTFDDLSAMIVEDYKANDRKSLRSVLNTIEHLRDGFGAGSALAITTDRITRYIRERREATTVTIRKAGATTTKIRKAGAAAATVRKELMALRRMFTLAIRAGRIPAAPAFPSIEVRNTRKGFFEEDELRAVLEHLEPEYAAAIEFLALTGWRKGEMLGLTWRQVDFRAGTIRLEPGETKNDEGRTFPFTALPPLADLMRRQREYTSRVERERGAVVAAVFHRDGQPVGDFHDAWERARVKAGLPGRLMHDLRRTAVRNLERAGVPRSVAMKLTGHKTESVYRRYAIVSEGDLSDGVAKLAKLHARSGSIRAAFGQQDAAAGTSGKS